MGTTGSIFGWEAVMFSIRSKTFSSILVHFLIFRIVSLSRFFKSAKEFTANSAFISSTKSKMLKSVCRFVTAADCCCETAGAGVVYFLAWVFGVFWFVSFTVSGKLFFLN